MIQVQANAPSPAKILNDDKSELTETQTEHIQKAHNQIYKTLSFMVPKVEVSDQFDILNLDDAEPLPF